MSDLEIISRTIAGQTRESAGVVARPLHILNVALTTPVSHRHYPLPLFSLAGSVERSQPNLHGMTLARSRNASEILDEVRAQHVDVLAVSAPQGTLQTLDETLQGISDMPLRRRPTIVLGGGLPTYVSERIRAKHPALSPFVIRGWGEKAYADVIQLISKGAADAGTKVIDGAFTNEYPNQFGVPPEGTVSFHYPRVEASKGCFWGACAYCLRPWHEQIGLWKQYEPDDVVGQVTALLKNGYRGYFEFADEEPIGTDIARFRGIVDRLVELRRTYPGFTFGINMRADHVIAPDPARQQEYDEFLRNAKMAGLTNVWMGAESYSQSQLALLRKGAHVTPSTNLEAARKIIESGIHVTQGFIPYHPLSTWKELREMALFMEPNAQLLSQVLGSPFGFLRVQFHTPYEQKIRSIEARTKTHLLGALDENMLSYQCKYLDPSIGLHAAYMHLVYDWINPYYKELNVRALTGDDASRDRLDRLRLLGVQLFTQSIKLLEPFKNDMRVFEQRQKEILEQYKRRFGELGIPAQPLEEALADKLTAYKEKFL